MFFWGASRRARVLPGSLGRFGASVLRAVTALCGGSAAGQRRFFAAAQGVEYALRNAFERKSSLATFHWRPVGTKDSLTSSLVMAIGACGQNDSRAKIPSVGMPLAFKSAKEAIGVLDAGGSSRRTSLGRDASLLLDSGKLQKTAPQDACAR